MAAGSAAAAAAATTESGYLYYAANVGHCFMTLGRAEGEQKETAEDGMTAIRQGSRGNVGEKGKIRNRKREKKNGFRDQKEDKKDVTRHMSLLVKLKNANC